MADSLAVEAQWRVRDVTADSPLLPADETGLVAQLGLRLDPGRESTGDAVRFSCTVVDETGQDRAVTLALVVPLPAEDWRWWDDPRTARAVEGDAVFWNLTDIFYGTGYYGSRYPLAAMDNGEQGLCLAAPLTPQRHVRFLYDAAAQEFRAEFDFGLSPIPERFPSRADAAVLAFEVPARWAFRHALSRYYDIHAGQLRRRAGEGGTFLTKSAIMPPPDQEDTEPLIPRHEDFHFTWHDFDIPVLWMAEIDDRLGIKSFLYREPQTDWRALATEDSTHDYETYVRELKADAEAGDREAQASLVSAVVRDDGRYDIYLDPIVWATRAPFGLNCCPSVPTKRGWPNKAEWFFDLLDTVLGWDGTPSHMDGVFFDSMEGWGNLLNYRQAHWRTTRHPLTFDRNNANAVCLLNIWGNVDLAKELAGLLHAHGQLLLGNDAFHKTWFHMPHVDVPGREVGYEETDDTYMFFRAMAARRPFWTLLNDVFDDRAMVEDYFNRSMIYGIFPSMFHKHDGESPWYWHTPEYFNRDRDLFRKYVPIIRRLDNARWQPVPWAEPAPETVWVERFGHGADDLLYTLHNPGTEDLAVTLSLDLPGLGARAVTGAQGLLTGDALRVEQGGADTATVHLTIPAGGYDALAIETD